MKNSLKSERRWLLFVAFITVVRLYLTADRDITALNSPHDEYWYIQTAIYRIWGAPYNEMTLIHLPVYSMWLGFLHLFGIPARFGIDIAWLLAVGYLSFAVNRLTRVTWPGLLLFAFLAFHPYTISLFDRALAETFLTVVSAAVMGAGIEIWNCRQDRGTWRRLAVFVYIVGFAIAFHTRKEGVVLVAPLIVLAGWTILDRKRWWAGSQRSAITIPLLLAPLVATLAVGSLLAGANFFKFGVMARHELAMPGYKRAIAALNSIDVGRTPRQITVTKQALSMAYDESPTFRELRPYMEGNPGQQWVAIAAPYISSPGEIGNGWFYWALRDVASKAGWHRDAKTAESKYAAVGDELDRAFASGRLHKRSFAALSFIDPDVEKWLPELPHSARKILSLVTLPELGQMTPVTENASSRQLDHYTAISGRRRMMNYSSVMGWAMVPQGSVVGIGNEQGSFSWSPVSVGTRPDIPGARAFSITSYSVEPPTHLHLLSVDGKTNSIALGVLKPGTVTTFDDDLDLRLGIDSKESNARGRRADRWLDRLVVAYQWVGYVFSAAIALLTIFAILLKNWRGVCSMVAGILVVSIMARIALFSILDASSWNGMQARYMFPVVPAYATAALLSIAVLFNAVHVRRRRTTVH